MCPGQVPQWLYRPHRKAMSGWRRCRA
jgi:hypothetical protein